MRTAGIERSGLSKCGVGVIGIIPKLSGPSVRRRQRDRATRDSIIRQRLAAIARWPRYSIGV
jgi:hypothetical protein